LSPGLLLALVLARVAWMARRWARAREAEAAERAVARHTLMVYAGLRDGRGRGSSGRWRPRWRSTVRDDEGRLLPKRTGNGERRA
jgi:hypothetical protein